MPEVTQLNLGSFESRPVVEARIKVTNAGDGLSKAIGVDPEKIKLGDRRYVVLEVVCTRVAFETIDNAPHRQQRIHTLKAAGATFIDAEYVEDAIEKQRIRIDEATGTQRLPEEESPAPE